MTTITKSVRLSLEESEVVARLSEQTFMTESSLLKNGCLQALKHRN